MFCRCDFVPFEEDLCLQSPIIISEFLGTVLAYGPQKSREQSSTLGWDTGEKSGISGEKSGSEFKPEKNPVQPEKNPGFPEKNSVSIVFDTVAWRGRGIAWRGVAWRDTAWRGTAWHVVAPPVPRGVAWRGVAWRGVDR